MRKIGSLLASALLVVAVGCGSDSDNGKKTPDGGGSTGHDGGNTPGLDTGPAPVVDADIVVDVNNTTPDAPIVIDGGAVDVAAIDAGKAVDSGAALDGDKGIDGGKIDGGAAVDTQTVDAGGCVLPSCMAAGGQGCIPTGTCTMASAASPSKCYPNGVSTTTQGALTDATGMSVTFKNGGAFCYTLGVDMTVIASYMAGTAAIVPVKDATGASVGALSFDPATLQASVTCTGAQPVALAPACSAAITALIPSAANTCTTGVCQ
jgi:hypothetical protein